MPDLVAPVLAPDALRGLEQPTIEAGALLLRPWAATDSAALLAAYADPAIQHFNGMALDEAEAAGYAERWARLWREGQRAGWAIDRAAGLVGRITLTRLDLEQGQAEVTYWVVASARGTGVMPAAVDALVRWAFDVGFHRLELTHSTTNTASCRVADRCGFALEGTKRRAVLHDDGWHDMHLHAKLAEHPRRS